MLVFLDVPKAIILIICSKMKNSTRSSFGPSQRKNCRSKRSKGFKSKVMNGIANDVRKSQFYYRQPNKRGNVNGDRRNDDRNKAQTHGVTSTVASKEIPKKSNRKESLSSSKPYNATTNTSSKLSKVLTSPPSRLPMLSPSKGVRSVPSTRREERRKEEATQGCRDHSWKNARQVRTEQSTTREDRGKEKNRHDRHDHSRKNAHQISREPSTRREESGNKKVTHDHQIHLGENENAHQMRSEPSTRREERGNKEVAKEHPNLLQKNARPMCSEDLLRDGKDGGLRISDECSEHSTVDHVNEFKLVKRKLEGCIQGRIPNVLGREEDDIGNVESTKGRNGQMGKKHKKNLDVSEESRHLASNGSIVQTQCRGFEDYEDGQDSRLVKDGIYGVSIPTILGAIKGHCSLPVDEPIWRYNIFFRLKFEVPFMWIAFRTLLFVDLLPYEGKI
jgi:hypothetical protein